MPDTTEAVASRLHEFIEAAKQKTSARPAQGEYSERMAPAARKEPILETYEAYLSKLTPDDLTKLDEIIKKMSGAV
jgi:hypothetical protein